MLTFSPSSLIRRTESTMSSEAPMPGPRITRSTSRSATTERMRSARVLAVRLPETRRSWNGSQPTSSVLIAREAASFSRIRSASSASPTTRQRSAGVLLRPAKRASERRKIIETNRVSQITRISPRPGAAVMIRSPAMASSSEARVASPNRPGTSSSVVLCIRCSSRS